MSDKFRIDSHKLIYHPERVADWQTNHENWEKAKLIYPIYVEISPFGACNHRCTFCAVDYIGYKNIALDPEILKTRLKEMAKLGVKSVMFAGEGEPTLYKALPEVLDVCSKAGIDTSLTTNMVPFNSKNIDSFLRNCSWIKTSINAGTAKTYSEIHRTREKDFDLVLENFRLAVKTRKEKGYNCTLGGQMILLPDNVDEAVTLGKELKNIGIDYLVIKPYSQHMYSETRKYENIDYKKMIEVENELKPLNGDGFSLVFRSQTIQNLFEEGKYERCQSTPFFWGYIMTDGSVYGCSAYLGDDRFTYGNINDSTFQEIWESEKRKENMKFVQNELDLKNCRDNCRMNAVNQYLWELKNPSKHVNFI
ncbi:MAG: radical SAM protein [Nitrospinae bacterium]|nr:radical SAM protein [Nitrospinota bacterium]